jgi:hypothetical protein
LAAAKRPGIRQLGLGGGVDPFQFYGRAGPGERDRRNIENSAMATAPSLRVAGGATTHSCLPIYCLNGSVQKAETLAANNAALIKRNWFVDWLWEKLEIDFGFHPPE